MRLADCKSPPEKVCRRREIAKHWEQWETVAQQSNS
jgi:hypothetical protein